MIQKPNIHAVDDLEGVTKEMWDTVMPVVKPLNPSFGNLVLVGTGGELNTRKADFQEIKDLFYPNPLTEEELEKLKDEQR